MGVPNGPTGCRLRHPLHSRLNPLPLLVKLVLWSRRTPKCCIGAQCTVEPTQLLTIREECCLQAKSTTEKVVIPNLEGGAAWQHAHLGRGFALGLRHLRLCWMEAQRNQVTLLGARWEAPPSELFTED